MLSLENMPTYTLINKWFFAFFLDLSGSSFIGRGFNSCVAAVLSRFAYVRDMQWVNVAWSFFMLGGLKKNFVFIGGCV